MIALACFLWLAASTSVQLVDEVYQIPAKDWRYVELGLNQKPALVLADYVVQSGSHDVRLALMRRTDLDRLRDGLPQGLIDVTGTGANGAFRPRVRGPGDFVIVVDNRGDTPAAVRLQIRLDFGVRGPEITHLTRQRQLTVTIISFAVFFGIVGWSAKRLLHEIKK